jgi:hypothetical protein
VRDRAIHADESFRREQTKSLGKFFGTQVQSRVGSIEATLRERRVVHRRRGGMRDRIADHRET